MLQVVAGAQRLVVIRKVGGDFLEHPTVLFDAENRPALDGIATHPGVIAAAWNGALHVKLNSMDRLPDVVAAMVSNGVRLTRVEPQLPTLEHLYFEVQRALRGER